MQGYRWALWAQQGLFFALPVLALLDLWLGLAGWGMLAVVRFATMQRINQEIDTARASGDRRYRLARAIDAWAREQEK